MSIYKAKFHFMTNRTISGMYEKIELSYLFGANSFAEAELGLKEIINRNHLPKNTPWASAMSIVKYDEIVRLKEDEISERRDQKFFDVQIGFRAEMADGKIKFNKKKLLIEHYSMDEAKTKAQDIAQKEKKILFDEFEVKKLVETDLYDIYV